MFPSGLVLPTPIYRVSSYWEISCWVEILKISPSPTKYSSLSHLQRSLSWEQWKPLLGSTVSVAWWPAVLLVNINIHNLQHTTSINQLSLAQGCDAGSCSLRYKHPTYLHREKTEQRGKCSRWFKTVSSRLEANSVVTSLKVSNIYVNIKQTAKKSFSPNFVNFVQSFNCGSSVVFQIVLLI